MRNDLTWISEKYSNGRRLQRLFYAGRKAILLAGFVVSKGVGNSWYAFLVNGDKNVLIHKGMNASCRLALQRKVTFHLENSTIDQIERIKDVSRDWQCLVAPSVTGGDWGVYGFSKWPSYSEWLVPGTLNMDKE